MFKWLGKLLAAFTGLFYTKADALNENKYVVKKTFDSAQSQLTDRINTITNALGSLIGSNEEKLQKIKDLEAKCDELERVQIGAQKMAQKRAQELQKQGKSKVEIQNDPEYIKCRTGYQDATSTLEQRQQRIAELESNIEQQQSVITDHQSQLQTLKGDLEKLHEEEHETIADMESSKAIESASKMLAGVAQSTVDEDLADVRKARQRIAGRAKASQQLAGTDAQRATDDFLKFAQQEEAASAFDDLMDWGDEDSGNESREASQLPEA